MPSPRAPLTPQGPSVATPRTARLASSGPVQLPSQNFQQQPEQQQQQQSGLQQSQLLDSSKRPMTAPGIMAQRTLSASLSSIRAVADLRIDYEQALGIRRGDLAVIPGETFRCYPRAENVANVGLVLKRLECVDRKTYDLKVYEMDTFARFQGHANILSLWSYWSEKPSNPYSYKSLVYLTEEGARGDLRRTIVQAANRPSERNVLKWACDIAKGLLAVHNCNIVHAHIKPSAIYLDANSTAKIGEFAKVELDLARSTHQLFSKLLIGEAMPHTLVYWAPELLRLEKYTRAIDMWALGVTIYELATGMQPFSVHDETEFRDDVLTANVDLDYLRRNGYPSVAVLVENLLRLTPEERWGAQDVLNYAQQLFALEVQKAYRGFAARRDFNMKRNAIIMIQSYIRGFVVKLRYQRTRTIRRQLAATSIQSTWKRHRARSWFLGLRSAFLRAQGNVLARQCRRSFERYRAAVVKCQSVVRRFLVSRWVARVIRTRKLMDNKLRTIQAMILRYREDAQQFAELFPESRLPMNLRYMASYEDFELTGSGGADEHELMMASYAAEEAGRSASAAPSSNFLIEPFASRALPRLLSSDVRITSMNSQLNQSMERLRLHDMETLSRREEDERMRQDLGVKYNEYGPMIEALKKNLRRVAEQCRRAEPLPCKLQHPYVYSKWDMLHEPGNVVENVLADDDSVYHAVAPSIDLTLYEDMVCFAAEIQIFPADPAPATVELYTSNSIDRWTRICVQQCSREGEPHTIHVPGEQLCRYIRLQFANNIRGGNMISLRHIRVLGLVKE